MVLTIYTLRFTPAPTETREKLKKKMQRVNSTFRVRGTLRVSKEDLIIYTQRVDNIMVSWGHAACI